MSAVSDALTKWVNGGPGDQDEGEEYGGPELTIVEHLIELRARLTNAVIGLVLGTVIGLIFSDPIFRILLKPAGPTFRPIFIEMTEMFTTYFKVAIMTGIALSSWWIIYQVLAFVFPGLTRKERRTVVRFLPAVAILYIIGMLFAYFVVLPFAANYLLNFSDIAQHQIRISNYIGFVTSIELWIGAAFETPLIIFMLAKIGLVNVQKLSRYRKYALLAVFIIAAAITPTPDPFNQTLVAVPLYMLYELGVLFARFA